MIVWLIDLTVKAVSSTLAGRMKVRKTSHGPQWCIAIVLNDGSDFLQVSHFIIYLYFVGPIWFVDVITCAVTS